MPRDTPYEQRQTVITVPWTTERDLDRHYLAPTTMSERDAEAATADAIAEAETGTISLDTALAARGLDRVEIVISPRGW